MPAGDKIAASRPRETFPNGGRPGRKAATKERMVGKDDMIVYEDDEKVELALIRRIFRAKQNR